MECQGCNAFGRMEEIINYNISEKFAVRVDMSCIQGALGQWATNVGLHQLHFYT